VEPAVAGICAGRLSPEAFEQLRQLIDDCDAEGRRAAPDQLETFLRLSHQFHSTLALHCGNSILADLTRQLVDVTAHPLWVVVNSLHVRDMNARAAQVAEHREILEAVRVGDREGATEAMADHLGRLAEDIFGRSRPSGTIVRQRRRAR
jgi:DNA-binding GntR family transcriptional regulator